MRCQSLDIKPRLFAPSQAEEYEELMADSKLSYEDRAALRRARRKMLKKTEDDLGTASPQLPRGIKKVGQQPG